MHYALEGTDFNEQEQGGGQGCIVPIRESECQKPYGWWYCCDFASKVEKTHELPPNWS